MSRHIAVLDVPYRGASSYNGDIGSMDDKILIRRISTLATPNGLRGGCTTPEGPRTHRQACQVVLVSGEQRFVDTHLWTRRVCVEVHPALSAKLGVSDKTPAQCLHRVGCACLGRLCSFASVNKGTRTTHISVRCSCCFKHSLLGLEHPVLVPENSRGCCEHAVCGSANLREVGKTRAPLFCHF